MAIPVTQLPPIAFPFELDSLTFGDEYLPANVEISYNGGTILKGVYTDTTIEGIASILVHSLVSDPQELSVKIDEDVYTCLVIPNATLLTNAAYLQTPAAQFVDYAFLSPLKGAKQTCLHGQEVLAFYEFEGSSQDGDKLRRIEATFLQNDGTVASFSYVDEGIIEEGYAQWDVSPQTIIRQTGGRGKLLEYAVHAGYRTQRYVVSYSQSLYMVRFMNSFMQWDTFYLSSLETELKPTRNLARIKRKLKTLSVEQKTQVKAFSLPLLDGEIPLAHDFICTKEALYEDRPISLIGEDTKHTSDPKEQPRISVSWQYASKRFVHTIPARVFTFDQTFDETYA